MGVLRDLFRLRKQMKAVQDETFGGTEGELKIAAELLHEAPGLIQAGLAASMQGLGQIQAGQAEIARLTSGGVQSTATFVAAKETGVALGADGFEQPLAEIDLDLHMAGEPDRRVTVRQLVPRLSLGRLVPGAVFPVMVDPSDHSKVVIEWGETTPAPPRPDATTPGSGTGSASGSG
jgi:hypothetical protein